MEKSIVYFGTPGKVNTEETFRLAKDRAEELGIKSVVLASTSGDTALKALEIFKDADVRLIVVGSSRDSYSQESLKILEEKGFPVRFSREVEHSYPDPVRNAFKKLSEGFKVAMQLGMIAAAEGLVQESEEIIAIAGTSSSGFQDGGGVDTAVVMLPRRSDKFYELPEKKDRRDIKEIICKPR